MYTHHARPSPVVRRPRRVAALPRSEKPRRMPRVLALLGVARPNPEAHLLGAAQSRDGAVRGADATHAVPCARSSLLDDAAMCPFSPATAPQQASTPAGTSP